MYSILIPLVLVRKELISQIKTNLFVFWGLIYTLTLLFLNSPIFLGRLWLPVTYIIFIWVPYKANIPNNNPNKIDENKNKLKVVLLVVIGFTITIIRLLFLKYNWWRAFRGR